MCSYWRRSFLLTPRRRRPLGISSPPGLRMLVGQCGRIASCPAWDAALTCSLVLSSTSSAFLPTVRIMSAAPRRTPTVRLSAYSRISSPQYQTASPPTSAPKTNRNIAVLLSRCDAQCDASTRCYVRFVEQEECHGPCGRDRGGNHVRGGGHLTERTFLLGKSYRPGHFSAGLSSRPARAASRSKPGRIALKKAFSTSRTRAATVPTLGLSMRPIRSEERR